MHSSTGIEASERPGRAGFVEIQLATRIGLGTPDGIERLLTALEQVDGCCPERFCLAPDLPNTRWPYDRQRFINRFLVPGFNKGELFQRRPFRYSSYFHKTDATTELERFECECDRFTDNEGVKLAYMIAEALVEQLPCELAAVHPKWNSLGNSDYGSTTLHFDKLQQLGPPSFFARTYLGEHLVNLIGTDMLHSSPALVTETANGIVKVDLCENPWEADQESLKNLHAELMRYLEPTKIFPRERPSRPGENWVPIRLKGDQ